MFQNIERKLNILSKNISQLSDDKMRGIVSQIMSILKDLYYEIDEIKRKQLYTNNVLDNKIQEINNNIRYMKDNISTNHNNIRRLEYNMRRIERGVSK